MLFVDVVRCCCLCVVVWLFELVRCYLLMLMLGCDLMAVVVGCCCVGLLRCVVVVRLGWCCLCCCSLWLFVVV